MSPLGSNKRMMDPKTNDFTCETCAMHCRYFTRVECKKRGHFLWEPADRSRCASCPSWHTTKQCCYRYDGSCHLLVEARRNLEGDQTAI
ncbi:MAG: hypothetical protein JW839_12725 [Candidatus Lokiarchaeota archaeon]|nr:hypothetical protein [Candidatus Lokiarchaeota archaeon]